MSDLKIKHVEFIKSSTELTQCPPPDKPEYAFTGRSNVGKSTLINALTNRTKLAKISSTPGKTRTINHFIINKTWYLVDLPGYGFAKRSKKERRHFKKMILEYTEKRENLIVLFVLIDARITPQRTDIDFINFLGDNQIPFYMVFTKVDKISPTKANQMVSQMLDTLKETWDELPQHFITSAKTKSGCQDILNEIDRLNRLNHVNNFF
jgi:GTP-binding protein